MKTVKNVSNHPVPIVVGGRVKTISEPGQKIDLPDDAAEFNVLESKGDIEVCGKKKKEKVDKGKDEGSEEATVPEVPQPPVPTQGPAPDLPPDQGAVGGIVAPIQSPPKSEKRGFLGRKKKK